MPHLTILDPGWRAKLEQHVDQTSSDELGNGDNVALVQASWVALLADCTGSPKPPKVYGKFFKRLLRDYDGCIKRAGELYHKLLSSVERCEDGTYVVHSLHKEFGWWPIFREYEAWYKTGDDALLTYIGTFLSWARKAEFNDPSLSDRALQNWLQVESELCRVDPPKKILEDLRFIFSCLPDPNIEDVDFKFGPGSVSEKGVKTLSDKLSLRYHPGLEYLLDLVASDAPGASLIIPDEDLWAAGVTDKEQASIDYATLTDVVKDRFSRRTICMEPNSLMFGQQGAARMLLCAISRSPFGRIINIEDQSRNAMAALRASEDGSYDTLDLERASDRAIDWVITFVMPPLWKNLFHALRSSRVLLPSGRIKTVEKHAPMGSALCFPIQTLVFTGIITLARFIRQQGYTYEQYINDPFILMTDIEASVDPRACVYGDDIICDRRETMIVMSLLEALGFRVNKNKSYYGAKAFRESCGTYAMRGTVITPLMFKVKGLAEQANYNLRYIEGLLSLCNRLYVAGYYSTHAFLSGYIPRQFYVEVSDDTVNLMPYHLLSVEPDNRPLRQRENPSTGDPNVAGWGLQRLEYRIKTYRPKVESFDNEARHRYGLARFYMSPSVSEGAKPQIGDVLEQTVRRVWVAS